MEQWEPFFAVAELGPQHFGVVCITVEFALEEREQFVVCSDEFFPVFLCDLCKVADHPAFVLKFPFTGKPNEPKIGCDIGKERELPAT